VIEETMGDYGEAGRRDDDVQLLGAAS
jgi:hypothetical protein